MKISKNKMMIAVIIVLCAIAAILVSVLFINKNRNNDDKFTPTLDSDAGDIQDNNNSGGQQGQAIRIPGYQLLLLQIKKM